MPSGKPKTMAVDLTGKFLSASREVRIVTNLCLYWDEIYLIETSGAPPNRMTAVPMETADLHFRGFSKAKIDPQRKQPEMFDYQKVSFTSMWNPTPGNYTRYGGVATLLADPDDKMSIMGSGDEIAMRFAAGGLARRCPRDGSATFCCWWTGGPRTRTPIRRFRNPCCRCPSTAMSSYPYPNSEAYPHDAAHAQYVREFLTRPALRLIRPLVGPNGT